MTFLALNRTDIPHAGLAPEDARCWVHSFLHADMTAIWASTLPKLRRHWDSSIHADGCEVAFLSIRRCIMVLHVR